MNVNGPASAAVASHRSCRSHNLVHKKLLSFVSVGHGELHAMLPDAYDGWTWESAVTKLTVLALVGGPASHCIN